MPDCLDPDRLDLGSGPGPFGDTLPAAHVETILRLRRAAEGNARSPDGVSLQNATRRNVTVGTLLTLTIEWTTEVEIRAGAEMLRSAIYCRNTAELDATLARDLDAEAASLEAAHRLAALIGSPEAAFREGDEPPALPSLRGPYYLHEVCKRCTGGGVRGCTGPGCRGGKAKCDHDGESGSGDAASCESCGGRGVVRCPVCAGAGVVSCEDCRGIGQFTHIHHPHLTVRPARGFLVPPDAPTCVGQVLEAVGFDRFADVAVPEPQTVRHSGTQLLYEQSGIVPVVTLSCVCDGVPFAVETVGPGAAVPAMPAFLDQVLAPVLARIQAEAGPDAFATASSFRLTKAVADAVRAGREPDVEAIIADHEGCVSHTFVAEVAAVLQRHFAATGRIAVSRTWMAGAVLLALVMLLVAGVDVPAWLTGATAEQPVPLPLRLAWDIGVPVLAGLGLWALVGGMLRWAMDAAFGSVVRAIPQGPWPAVVLGAAAALHLALLTVWNGGPAVSRIHHTLDLEAIASGQAPLPAPHTPSASERVMAAQRALARLGRYDGAIDGKMGDATKAGLASLSTLTDMDIADPLDLAVAIAADRVTVNTQTPDLLIGPGWSNATRLRMLPDDQPLVAAAFLNALGAPNTAKAWQSGDGTRYGEITVTSRVEDPKARNRLCFAFTHVVTTPAGRDAGVPLRACRTEGRWMLEE
jgi:DnaJ-class molecular chaperone with C-terminal Zn finger domain